MTPYTILEKRSIPANQTHGLKLADYLLEVPDPIIMNSINL